MDVHTAAAISQRVQLPDPRIPEVPSANEQNELALTQSGRSEYVKRSRQGNAPILPLNAELANRPEVLVCYISSVPVDQQNDRLGLLRGPKVAVHGVGLGARPALGEPIRTLGKAHTKRGQLRCSPARAERTIRMRRRLHRWLRLRDLRKLRGMKGVGMGRDAWNSPSSPQIGASPPPPGAGTAALWD